MPLNKSNNFLGEKVKVQPEAIEQENEDDEEHLSEDEDERLLRMI